MWNCKTQVSIERRRRRERRVSNLCVKRKKAQTSDITNVSVPFPYLNSSKSCVHILFGEKNETILLINFINNKNHYYRVIQKEYRNYKKLSLRNFEHIILIQVFKFVQRTYIWDLLRWWWVKSDVEMLLLVDQYLQLVRKAGRHIYRGLYFYLPVWVSVRRDVDCVTDGRDCLWYADLKSLPKRKWRKL